MCNDEGMTDMGSDETTRGAKPCPHLCIDNGYFKCLECGAAMVGRDHEIIPAADVPQGVMFVRDRKTRHIPVGTMRYTYRCPDCPCTGEHRGEDLPILGAIDMRGKP